MRSQDLCRQKHDLLCDGLQFMKLKRTRAEIPKCANRCVYLIKRERKSVLKNKTKQNKTKQNKETESIVQQNGFSRLLSSLL